MQTTASIDDVWDMLEAQAVWKSWNAAGKVNRVAEREHEREVDALMGRAR